MYYGAATIQDRYLSVYKCNQLHAGMWQVRMVQFLVSHDSFGPLKEHSPGFSDKYGSGTSAMALLSCSHAGFSSVSLTAHTLLFASHNSSPPSTTLQSSVGSSQCPKSTKHIKLRTVIYLRIHA